MKSLSLRVLPALLMAAFSGLTSAASFQRWEQNASGLGVAYAGSAAVADNASTNYFNPAGLTQLDGYQLSVGMVGLGSRYEFRDNGSISAGAGNGGNAGSWSVLPNLYISARLTEDLSAGFGISAPFKVATEYNNGWLGQVQALKTDISAVNYNPSLAYRINDKVSIGLGVNYQRLNAELSSFDPVAPGINRFEGDDTAWGWNAGALFKLSPAMKVGIAYRSGLSYRLDGTRTVGAVSTPATANLKLPGTATLSVWQQVSDRWEAMGDLSYTRWNQANGMVVASAAGNDVENFNYKNAWRLAWGAAYKANDALKLKFGIAYDRSPVQLEFQSARIPDADRLWLTLGGQWNAGRYGKFDLGYAYVHFKDPSISQTKLGTTLRGEYDAGSHVLGMQYSVGF